MLNLRCADFWGSQQINDLNPFFFQKIKLTFPVIPHNKDIHIILMHIRTFLLPTLLRNNKINIANSFKKLFTLLIGKVSFLCFSFQLKSSEDKATIR